MAIELKDLFNKTYSQDQFFQEFDKCIICEGSIRPGWITDGPMLWSDCKECNISIEAIGDTPVEYPFVYQIHRIKFGYSKSKIMLVVYPHSMLIVNKDNAGNRTNSREVFIDASLEKLYDIYMKLEDTLGILL